MTMAAIHTPYTGTRMEHIPPTQLAEWDARARAAATAAGYTLGTFAEHRVTPNAKHLEESGDRIYTVVYVATHPYHGDDLIRIELNTETQECALIGIKRVGHFSEHRRRV